MKTINGLEEFNKEVLENKKTVLVDFYADWCGPCKALSPTLEELSSEYADSLEVIKVNVDDNRELATKYNIRGIPAIFFFKDGEVKSLLSGNQPKAALVQEIQTFA